MMTWQFTPFLLLVVVAAVLTGLLAVFAWRRREAHAAGALVAIAALACLWTTTYAFEVAAITLAAKLFWIRIEYLAIATLPVAWLIFAIRFAQRDPWITSIRKLLLLIIPAITILLVWTEPAHGIYYRDLDTRVIEGLAHFAPQYGPWFWVHSLYAYACYLAGVVLIFLRLREASGAYQRQAEIVLVGSLPPFVTSFIFVSSPTTLDPTPVAFAVSSLVFGWGLFRLRLLDESQDLPLSTATAIDTSLTDTLAASRLRILNLVLRGLAVLGAILLATAVVDAMQNPPVNVLELAGLAAVYAMLLAVTFLERVSFATRGGFLLLILFLLAYVNMRRLGIDVDAGILLVAFTAIAFILFGRVVGLVAMVVSLLTLGLNGWQIVTGELIVEPRYVAGASPWVVLVPLIGFALFVGAILISQASLLERLQALLNQSQELSHQLEEERRLLEERVAERTRALSISAALSRQLSTILDRETLIEEVVNRLREAFDYYHSHIYLLDEETQMLHVVGGTGEPGREMAERGFSLPLGVGLVGRAALTGTTILARDVGEETNWLANPLLPDTRSEIAIPIQFADKVLGVLDVQQRVLDGFDVQDRDLLHSVANQLAVVLRNARLYAEAKRRAEHEALVNQISQRILRTNDVESALKVAVLELGEALGAGQTEVRLSMGHNARNGAPSQEREADQRDD